MRCFRDIVPNSADADSGRLGRRSYILDPVFNSQNKGYSIFMRGGNLTGGCSNTSVSSAQTNESIKRQAREGIEQAKRQAQERADSVGQATEKTREARERAERIERTRREAIERTRQEERERSMAWNNSS